MGSLTDKAEVIIHRNFIQPSLLLVSLIVSCMGADIIGTLFDAIRVCFPY